ncbi:hypothetical protein KM043_014041 [Ampulex compressa]|nr:hypothetical protein KM043_014041 [Ampulex compressa]
MDPDRDLRIALAWNRFNLNLVGIWPISEQSTKERFYANCRVLITGFFMIAFISGPQSVNLVFIWGDIDSMSDNLSVANITVINGFLKLVVLWHHRKTLFLLVDSFFRDWQRPKSQTERSNMLSNAWIGRRISIWCTVIGLSTLSMLFVMRAVSIARMDRHHSSPDRVLIHRAYFPYDVRKSPVFELTCLGQVVTAVITTIAYTGTDSFICMLVLHTCSQLANLRGRLERLIGAREKDEGQLEFRAELARIVRRHEHLSWFAKTIEDCFNVLLLAQLMTCSVQVCFQCFLLLMTLAQPKGNSDAVKVFFLSFFVMFNMLHFYIYCYVGEMLLVQSSGMKESAYETAWYNVSSLEARNLLFIMYRSTVPLRLSAGKFSTLSLQLFSSRAFDGTSAVRQHLKQTEKLWGSIAGKSSFDRQIMDFAMGWNRFNLSVLGVWPEPVKTSSSTRRISSLIYWTSTSVTFLFICAPQTAHLLLESASLDEVIENLSINVPIAFALIKQIVLRYHGKALKSLLHQIFEDWSGPIPEIDRQTMLKSAKISRSISIVCSTLTYLMLFAFIFLQIWSNLQNTSEADLGGLLHPATFPYDTKKSPNFEITWFGQFMGTVLTAICYSCFDTFLAVLVLHLCGQLNVLRIALKNLVDATKEKNFSKFQEKLRFIVRRHDQLYRFAIVVEDCFNLTLLVQTVISTTMFCLTGYRMLTSVDEQQQDVPLVGLIFYIIHVIYTMLHLFIYCYIGETLLVQSTGIAESAYECNWYDLPPKKALTLSIVICRSRISFQITAGKFSPFSLQLFSAVLRTAAGYLSVLLAMADHSVEEE